MTSITQKPFGELEKTISATLFTLDNGNMKVAVTNLGAAIVSIISPDKCGKLSDVVLGYDSAAEYLTHGGYLGAVVGRVGNRIEKGQFELGGKAYQLCCNDGKNHLHGGNSGFDKKLWRAKICGESLELTLVSPDGDENYPGTLTATVTYTLSADNKLGISYHAESDKDTIINLTNHSYFNLAGHDSGSICDHFVKIYADEYTPVNGEVMPTGAIAKVEGTPYDLREFVRIGDRIDCDEAGFKNAGGFDHNWVVGKVGDSVHLVCEVKDETSGRLLKAYTNKPGMQFYSGNFLDDGTTGKASAIYNKRSGLCLETQFFPNAMAHDNFPSIVLKAGEVYSFTTEYEFDIVK